ncbi:protein kinase [Bacillus sp. V3B]|uniref:serine/threonine protein kinase n=1 Tax=Bacillus sp. V3B TaxID=2804915 RepID=UPI00210ACD29|nr:protein kinase [Bacillus sp. V3B]MCQ6276619.1 protein kinase [Bacillus sp. V3B]
MIKRGLLLIADLLEKPFKSGKLIEERYEIVEFLGRGSYGNSYLVYDREKQSQAVIKLLRLHKRIFKAGKITFEQEQQLLKELNHPFFPAFYNRGQYHGTPFFTMEHVNGKTFEQLIFEEGKTYSEKETFQIGLQLLQIINWLHHNGIVHRDIRIPNVMITQDQLKVIDFGLARRWNSNHFPSFHLDQIKKVISPISDFYALGHFLLFLLYSTYELEDEKEKSWEEELDLSDSAHKIIRRLLAIDEPYQSCQEIEKDFFKV